MPDLETPDEDAVEQRQETQPEPGAGEAKLPAEPKWDADDADVAESAIEVPLEDEDYR